MVPPDAQAALLVVFAQYEARVQALEKRIAELEQRLGITSSNSSTPPSANPLGAPKPVVKKPTGRNSGGQPGHQGHTRQRLPKERVDHVIALIPSHCERCHSPLPVEPSPADPEPDPALRKRGGDVLGYLTEALKAHRHGLPVPSVFSRA